MRPLELTVAGLRSYRAATTVTFPDDWQLAAVVGLTGAGKSSLLEAIVYALFGSGTVPGASQPINLITDDAREMRVVLRFAIGPERFEIARIYRRGGNVQPVLKTAARTYSGAKEVEDAVTRLLGLRQEAFCSTVLLPQGQFAALLQAAAGAQKETLDAFFRLGEVTELSDRLVGAAATLASRRREVETVRDQLPPDLAADIRHAEQRLRDAEQQRDTADKLAEVVALHEKSAADAATRAETARRRAAELMKAAGDLNGVAVRAGRLVTLALEMASAERALTARADAASAAVRAARDALSALDAPGVEATAARVNTLLERIREASAARNRASSAAADGEHAHIELEQVRTDHGRLVQQRDRARIVHEHARALKDDASERFDGLRRHGDDAGRSANAAEAAEVRRAAAARDLELTRTVEGQARHQLVEAVAKLTSAEAETVIARMALQGAETAAAAASHRAEDLGRLRREVDERRSERDRVSAGLAASRLGLEEARITAGQAARAESEAEMRWRQAQAVGQEARREDSVAAAAVGCGPGDLCPVCARELPESFVPPAPSARARDAEVAEGRARDELASSHRAAARAEAELNRCTSEEASAADQLSAAEAMLVDAECLLAAEGGADWERVTAAADAARELLANARQADQVASNTLTEARADRGAIERNIEPLAVATQRAETALAAATTDRDKAADASERSRDAFVGAGGDGALAKARTDLAPATEALATTKSLLDAAETSAGNAEARLNSAERRAAALGAAADSAAAQVRRAEEAVTNAMAIIPVAARRGASDDPAATAEAAGRWVAERRTLIAEAERRRIEAEAAFDQARREGEDLRARRVAELERPLADATSAGTRLAATADVPSPAATLGPADLGAWAAAASGEIRRRAADRQREAEAADVDIDQARAAAHAACAEVGVERDRLDGWHAEMQREVGAAAETWRRATEVAERARALDAALAASAEHSRVLGLARDLCQGKESFANHVLVARRQGLIAEAAAILTELSNGRLTFAEDVAATFSVLDTGTGAVRDPRLLSGGEQFQASLALALGLVEIAARAGSRIECLFLDEGFGALDPASLDIALDALEAAARRGRRMVAVTHVDAVTARADQVLGVAGSESGSRAAWRGVELGTVA